MWVSWKPDLLIPARGPIIREPEAAVAKLASRLQAVFESHFTIDALRWYRAMGGERLTFGSDGHHPDHVGYGFAIARELAQAAGFTRVCCYENRQVVRWIEI